MHGIGPKRIKSAHKMKRSERYVENVLEKYRNKSISKNGGELNSTAGFSNMSHYDDKNPIVHEINRAR